jgi:hypothetical protein
MPLEDNKMLVRRYFEDAPSNPAACDEIFAPYFQFQAIHHTAMNDRVMVRWTFYGRQQGEFAGLPQTYKLVTYSGINIFRIADGKIEEIGDISYRLWMCITFTLFGSPPKASARPGPSCRPQRGKRPRWWSA